MQYQQRRDAVRHALRCNDDFAHVVAQVGAGRDAGDRLAGGRHRPLEKFGIAVVSLDGPVVTDQGFWIIDARFDGIDEAVAKANNQSFGLAVGLFTSNLHTAFKAARELRFGGVHINEASSARVDAMPFGGVKDSGFGNEGGKEGLETYQVVKAIHQA